MKKLLYLSLILLMIVSGGRSFALSSDQIRAFESGVYYFNTEDSTCSSTSILQGSDNQQQAFNYFVTKGFTSAQSAGIVGNLIQESGVNPLRNEMNNGPGRGIAQWTVNERWAVLLRYAASRGDSGSLALQLDFIMAELTGTYPSTLADLKATTDLKSAVDVFLTEYERAGTANQSARLAHALDVLKIYGDSTIGDSLSSNQGNCVTTCPLDSSTASLDVSSVRKSVVCLAQQELALWTPSYDRQNYLKYTQSAPDPWCADFVSWIYNQAGYPLGTELKWRYAAVFEIKQIGNNNINFHYHESTSYTPQPGDLAIHAIDSIDKNNLHRVNFYHVNMVVDVNVTSKTMTLIGGDQGSGPYGGPASQSVVSKDTAAGFSSNDIIGYVSPD